MMMMTMMINSDDVRRKNTDHGLSVGVSIVVEQEICHVEPVLLGCRVKSREPVLHARIHAQSIAFTECQSFVQQ